VAAVREVREVREAVRSEAPCSVTQERQQLLHEEGQQLLHASTCVQVEPLSCEAAGDREAV
jgi:hypothetical protein